MRWYLGREGKTIIKKPHHTTEQIIRILRAAETSGQNHEGSAAK
jgi:hypothetical protein